MRPMTMSLHTHTAKVLLVDDHPLVLESIRQLLEPNFTIVGMVTGVNEIDRWLERGRAWMALGIPAGYGQQVGAGRPAVVQVVADGTDANSTNVALAALRLIASRPSAPEPANMSSTRGAPPARRRASLALSAASIGGRSGAFMRPSDCRRPVYPADSAN